MRAQFRGDGMPQEDVPFALGEFADRISVFGDLARLTLEAVGRVVPASLPMTPDVARGLLRLEQDYLEMERRIVSGGGE